MPLLSLMQDSFLLLCPIPKIFKVEFMEFPIRAPESLHAHQWCFFLQVGFLCHVIYFECFSMKGHS